MNPIILVAETGSDLTPELAARYHIRLVPMHVSFDSETLDDGSFPVQKIVDYYHETGKLPRTSGSSPEDFNQVFDAIHLEYPDGLFTIKSDSKFTQPPRHLKTCYLKGTMVKSNYTGCFVPIVHLHPGVQLRKECVANGNVC